MQSLSWAYGVVIDEGGNALTAPRIATLKGHKARLDRLLKETVEYKRIADEKERAAIVARWLDGEHINNFYATAPSGGAYIRAENVEHDESGAIVGGILRTSQGATVPLIHAVRVFRMVKMVRASGKRWQRNGARIRVGHFEVDHIEPNGDFKAGCHRLKWFEIEPLAKSLGVFDAPALEIQHDKESA